MTSQIEYREMRDLPRDGVLVLYGACRWSSAEKPDELMSALAGSQTVVSAWDSERLVGLGNAITDGALVVYYPHLLVHPDYQRRGIGREIMRRLQEKYAAFHQHAVLADQRATGFYRECGFSEPAGVRPMWIYAAGDHNPPETFSIWRELLEWRIRVPRQQWALGIAVAQLAATALAAYGDIGLNLVTWPMLAAIGVVFCVLTWPLRSVITFTYGVSAPLVTGLGASLIIGLDWVNGRSIITRHDMEEVTTGLALFYGVFLLPSFFVLLPRLVHWQSAPSEPSKPKWQFSLRSLMVIMTIVAVSAALFGGATRVATDKFALLIYGGYATLVFAMCGVIIERFMSDRRKGRTASQ